MIRINLLPRRKEVRREESHVGVFALIGLLVIEAAAIIVLHAQKKKELDQAQSSNQVLENAIAEKRTKLADHENIKRQLAEFQAREDAITKLQRTRTGPTAVLIELSHALTPHKMPTSEIEVLDRLRRDNPSALPSDSWDPRRLWLSSFRELALPATKAGDEPERAVSITGAGKAGTDIDEFLRRLSVSRYFADVRLLKREERSERDTKGNTNTYMTFELRAKIRY